MSENPKTLGGLELTDAAGVQANAFARVLLLGPPKSGKTSSVLLTAPRPILHINCDYSVSAAKGAARLGAEFQTVFVTSRASWFGAIRGAIKAAEAGEFRTIAVDPISVFGDTALTELKAANYEGWALWGALEDTIVGGCKLLLAAPAHVFLISHMTAGGEETAGILPAIGGRTKLKLPSVVDDWVVLDLEPERKPHERQFLIGPQKYWSGACRNAQRTCSIPADIGVLLSELGITP